MGPESTEKTLGPVREIMREPQNSSNAVPCFQKEADVVDHTGGTYSNGDVIDNSIFPVSEKHLGKFPGYMEFQSWKVNFKTEACSKT